MWKIKKEYHYYLSPRNVVQDRYINKGDLISGAEGTATYYNYLNMVEERNQNFFRGEEPKCPDLVFDTKEEATEAMNKVAFFGNNPETYYYLSYGEYSRPTLSVQFHWSWK